MLNDRDYMRRSGGGAGGGGDMPGTVEAARNCIWVLIGINVAMFLLPMSAGLFQDLMLSSVGLRQGKYYELLTAMFLHANIWHLLLNMWALYLFGMMVAPLLGVGRFLTLYFVSGLTGNLLYLAFNWHSMNPLLGASGAVFGVMIALAMLLPQVQFMLLFPPIPLKASTMVVVFAVIEMFSQVLGRGGNVAHLAHLGGFLGGYLVLKIWCGPLLRWDPLHLVRRATPGGATRRPEFYQPPPPGRDRGDRSSSDRNEAVDDGSPITREEVDFLLDKISRSGINSLSGREQARLKRAREELRRR